MRWLLLGIHDASPNVKIFRVNGAAAARTAARFAQTARRAHSPTFPIGRGRQPKRKQRRAGEGLSSLDSLGVPSPQPSFHRGGSAAVFDDARFRSFVARMSEREAREIRVRFDVSRPPWISLRSSGILVP